MRIVLVLFLFIAGCCNAKSGYSTYLEAVNAGKSRYKVGQTIVITQGNYAGCHLKIARISATGHIHAFSDSVYFLPEYLGTSNDCPIESFSER